MKSIVNKCLGACLAVMLCLEISCLREDIADCDELQRIPPSDYGLLSDLGYDLDDVIVSETYY